MHVINLGSYHNITIIISAVTIYICVVIIHDMLRYCLWQCRASCIVTYCDRLYKHWMGGYRYMETHMHTIIIMHAAIACMTTTTTTIIIIIHQLKNACTYYLCPYILIESSERSNKQCFYTSLFIIRSSCDDDILLL